MKNVAAIYPLSPSQQGILLEALRSEARGLFVEQLTARLRGSLDEDAFERAWRLVVQREPALRTAFVWDGLPEPAQVVREEVRLPFEREDLRAFAPEEQERRLARALDDERRRGFELARAPLARVRLARLAEDSWQLAWSVHHLLLDGWSGALVLEAVLAAYASLARGVEPRFEERRPYRDFVEWLAARDRSGEREFWEERLRGFEPPDPLALPPPANGGRAPGSEPLPGRAFRSLDLELTRALGEFARAERITLGTLVQGAWAVLLARLGGRRDVLFGTVLHGRPAELEGCERMIGLFLETLPLRVRVEAAQPVGAWLRELQLSIASLARHPHASLSEIQRWSDLPPRARLFETLVAFENFPTLVRSEHPGAGGRSTVPHHFVLDSIDEAFSAPLRIENEMVRHRTSPAGTVRLGEVRALGQPDAPLCLTAVPGERLELELVWDARRFDGGATAARLGELEQLLRGMIASADAPLSRLRRLPSEERERVVVQGRETTTVYPRDAGLAELFDEVARALPDAAAAESPTRAISYRELAERSRELARRLLGPIDELGDERGVARGERVGLCAGGSCELALGMLAILRAGGAYLPLDPALPDERLALVLGDCGVRLVACDEAHRARFERLGLACVAFDLAPDLALGIDCPPAPSASAGGPFPKTCGADLAYVLTTSGSTGKPKGVAVPQRGVARLVLATDYVDLRPGHRIAQVSNPTFDLVTFEVWGALLNGATLLELSREVTLDALALERELVERRVTHLLLTTSLFHQIARDRPGAFARLEALLFAGEAASPERVRAVLEHGAPRHAINAYGPTEATTFASWHDARELPPGAAHVPIGIPIRNTELHVLDLEMEPVPDGLAGELFIGGDGLADGYLGRPDLTAASFVPHPFPPEGSRERGARLYATGDLVRRGARGELEFLGRIDAQVKLRGFRIELGEVEAALESHPLVLAAAAGVRDSSRAGARLVAWVVARDGRAPAADDLKQHLAARLPDYMVPAAIVALEKLPLTRSGKLDRRALPEPDWSEGSSRERRAARGGLEEVLAAAWCDVLGLDAVGVHDDFFELGGHSLLAMQLVSRLRHALGREVALSAPFVHPTVASLARALAADAGRAASAPKHAPSAPAPSASESDPAPLSLAQERLWILEALDPGHPTYHLAGGIRLRGELDFEALRASLEALVARHAALRTVFAELEGEPRQSVGPSEGLELACEDLSGVEPEARRRRLDEWARERARAPFDLARGPLHRFGLARLSPGEHVLAVVLHHLIADGWSLRVLVNELGKLYRERTLGEPAALEPLEIDYATWARAQREELAGERTDALVAHWKRVLAGAPPSLELPADRARPAERAMSGATEALDLDAALVRRLRELSRSQGTTLFMTLFAGFASLLQRLTGQDDLLVGTPVAGRDRREAEGLVGFFVNTLVLRCDLAGDPSVAEALARVRRTAVEAYAHADLPFARLVQELRPERRASHGPLFQAMFAWNEGLGRTLELSGLEVEPFEIDIGASAFDWTLAIEERGEALRAVLEYSTELFDAATIARALRLYARLLGSMAERPERRLSQLALLDPAERARLLALGEGPAPAEGPVDRASLAELLAESSRRAPDALALVQDGRRITHRELQARAARLACELAAQGAGPETIVAVCAPRSVELVVAQIAILRAGAAWLALDPALPDARIARLLSDSRARLALATRENTARLARAGVRAILLDASQDTKDEPELDARDALHLRASGGRGAQSAAGERAAYVIYTSGSTGEPKGVVVPERALAGAALAAARHFELRAEDRVLQMASIGFDLSLEELFPALLAGAGVVIHADAAPLAPHELAALAEREKVSVLDLPTAYWHEWVRALEESDARVPASVRLVIAGGERASSEAYAAWRRLAGARVRWLNTYGPTEATITATWFDARGAELAARSVPIGRPFAGWRVRVLDLAGELAPIGVPGELAIGGAGLSRGYLGLPAATAERFVPDAHASEPGARVFLTGDRARWREDGELEFLGRGDEQVKIRGFRVEPGETEAELLRLEGVAQAAVVVVERRSRARLAGFVVPRAGAVLDARAARERLLERLPDYLVPASVSVLDELPRTPAGKIDRAALAARAPEPSAAGRSENGPTSDAPAGAAEEALAELWRGVLGVERVGREDHFFELGGDSIQAIQLAARASRAGLSFAPKDVFRHPRLAELARAASAPSAARFFGARTAAHAEPASGAVPLTPIQRWFFEQDLEDPQHWNQSLVLETRALPAREHLERAADALARRHDALRLRFDREGARWSARIAATEERSIAVESHDWSAKEPATLEADFERECARLQASLDLGRGPLARFAAFDLGRERPARLVALAHHLVVDGVSWRLLIEELELELDEIAHGAGGAIAHGAAPALAPPRTSWRAWAEGLDALARSASPLRELERWLPPAGRAPAALPRDRDRGAGLVREERCVSAALDEVETRGVAEAAQRLRASLEELVVAALARTLARWSGSPHVRLELEGHGREPPPRHVESGNAAVQSPPEPSETVGWFTTVAPVEIDLRAAGSSLESLRASKETLRALEGRGAGWMLLRYGGGATDARIAELPAPEVSFNFLGRFDGALRAGSRFRLLRAGAGPERSPAARRTHLLEIAARVHEGRLALEWLHGPAHEPRTIERLAGELSAELRAFLHSRGASSHAALSPSDFPLARLDPSQLAKAAAQLDPARKRKPSSEAKGEGKR